MNAYDHPPGNRKYLRLLDTAFRLPLQFVGPFLMRSIRQGQMARKEMTHRLKRWMSAESAPTRIKWSYHPSNDSTVYRGYSAQEFCALAETRNVFAREVLRPTVVSLAPGRLAVELPYRYSFTGNFSAPCLHGGVAAALMDQCGGWCAATILRDMNERISTVNLRLDYLAPAPCFESIICEAEVTHREGNLIFVSAICWNHTKTKKLVLGKIWFNVYLPKKM